MTAFEHLTIGADNRIHSLFAPQLGPLFDPVKWHLGGAAENREHRHLAQARDPVVAPFARRDHTPVERQDDRKLGPVKRHLLGCSVGRVRGDVRNCWYAHTIRVALPVAQIKPLSANTSIG